MLARGTKSCDATSVQTVLLSVSIRSRGRAQSKCLIAKGVTGSRCIPKIRCPVLISHRPIRPASVKAVSVETS